MKKLNENKFYDTTVVLITNVIAIAVFALFIPVNNVTVTIEYDVYSVVSPVGSYVMYNDTCLVDNSKVSEYYRIHYWVEDHTLNELTVDNECMFLKLSDELEFTSETQYYYNILGLQLTKLTEVTYTLQLPRLP